MKILGHILRGLYAVLSYLGIFFVNLLWKLDDF